MATVIDTLSKAARHGMFVRAECRCGNTKYYRAIDLALEIGGHRDPRSIPFRCGVCQPKPIKISVLEMDAEERRKVQIWEPHEVKGRVVWMPRRGD